MKRIPDPQLTTNDLSELAITNYVINFNPKKQDCVLSEHVLVDPVPPLLIYLHLKHDSVESKFREHLSLHLSLHLTVHKSDIIAKVRCGQFNL